MKTFSPHKGLSFIYIKNEEISKIDSKEKRI